jgi:hypothetical protein
MTTRISVTMPLISDSTVVRSLSVSTSTTGEPTSNLAPIATCTSTTSTSTVDMPNFGNLISCTMNPPG